MRIGPNQTAILGMYMIQLGEMIYVSLTFFDKLVSCWYVLMMPIHFNPNSNDYF